MHEECTKKSPDAKHRGMKFSQPPCRHIENKTKRLRKVGTRLKVSRSQRPNPSCNADGNGRSAILDQSIRFP